MAYLALELSLLSLASLRFLGNVPGLAVLLSEPLVGLHSRSIHSFLKKVIKREEEREKRKKHLYQTDMSNFWENTK